MTQEFRWCQKKYNVWVESQEALERVAFHYATREDKLDPGSEGHLSTKPQSSVFDLGSPRIRVVFQTRINLPEHHGRGMALDEVWRGVSITVSDIDTGDNGFYQIAIRVHPKAQKLLNDFKGERTDLSLMIDDLFSHPPEDTDLNDFVFDPFGARMSGEVPDKEPGGRLLRATHDVNVFTNPFPIATHHVLSVPSLENDYPKPQPKSRALGTPYGGIRDIGQLTREHIPLLEEMYEEGLLALKSTMSPEEISASDSAVGSQIILAGFCMPPSIDSLHLHLVWGMSPTRWSNTLTGRWYTHAQVLQDLHRFGQVHLQGITQAMLAVRPPAIQRRLEVRTFQQSNKRDRHEAGIHTFCKNTHSTHTMRREEEE